MTLRPTQNDLPLETRTRAIDVLQQVLSQSIDLRSQMLQAHWNVRSPNFQMLHELFGAFAEGIDEYIDDSAERIVQLGGYALGTTVSAAGSLPAYPDKITRGEDHLVALVERIAAVGKHVRGGIETTDADSADLLTGFSRFLDKQLWFFESHIR